MLLSECSFRFMYLLFACWMIPRSGNKGNWHKTSRRLHTTLEVWVIHRAFIQWCPHITEEVKITDALICLCASSSIMQLLWRSNSTAPEHFCCLLSQHIFKHLTGTQNSFSVWKLRPESPFWHLPVIPLPSLLRTSFHAAALTLNTAD